MNLRALTTWMTWFQPALQSRSKTMVKIRLQLPPSLQEQAAMELAEGGQMVFPLEKKGDLPNLIQFLAGSRRSGRLELKFYVGEDAVGNIYFQNGDIPYAAFAGYHGTEALARMTNRGRADTRFFNGEMTSNSNITEHDAAKLLVDMVIMADELVAAGRDICPDEISLLPDEPPIPMDEPAMRTVMMRPSGDGGAPPAPDGMPTAPAGMQTQVRKPAPAPAAPPASPAAAASVKPRAPREPWAIPRTTEILFAIFMLVLFLSASWWLGLAPDSWYRTLSPQMFAQENETASVLQRLRFAIRLRISELKQRFAIAPTFSRSLQKAEKLYLNSVQRINAGDYSGAMLMLRETRSAVDEITLKKQEQEQAVATMKGFSSLLADITASDAPKRVPRRWEALQKLITDFETAFREERFSGAEENCQKAAAQIREITAEAAEQPAAAAARQRYETDSIAADPGLLAEFGGPAFAELRRLQQAADAADTAESFREATPLWIRARELLPKIHASALETRNLKQFAGIYNNGIQQLTQKNWSAAETAFREALAVPGFPNHAGARTGLRDAQVGGLLEGADQARRADDWSTVQAKCTAALELQPDNATVRVLLAEAAENLIPRLIVMAAVDKLPVPAAVVGVNDRTETVNLPVQYQLEMGKTYRISVDLPVWNNTAIEPYTLEYKVEKPGRQKLTAVLKPLPMPMAGRPWILPGTGIMFSAVPAGRFQMGSRKGQDDELPIHEVVFTRPFWVGRTEVTNGQYRMFIRESGYTGQGDASSFYLRHFKGTSSSDMPAGDEYPVCYVNWRNANAFCHWLTMSEAKAGRLPAGFTYRLPTEAEWEYACRAGSEENFAGPLDQMAWYSLTGRRGNQPVATKQASLWGLHDMHGNVWEWCEDNYTPTYPAAVQVNPRPVTEGIFKVMRGGSWNSTADLCRSANRSSIAPSDSNPDLGFRVVLGPDFGDAPAAAGRPATP